MLRFPRSTLSEYVIGELYQIAGRLPGISQHLSSALNPYVMRERIHKTTSGRFCVQSLVARCFVIWNAVELSSMREERVHSSPQFGVVFRKRTANSELQTACKPREERAVDSSEFVMCLGRSWQIKCRRISETCDAKTSALTH